uniref:BZIP domain-containing protein n=1 Tax=Heterorhabditis bacteriophora TaxID=37862 RepID=A0A1I7XBH6_HETBA
MLFRNPKDLATQYMRNLAQVIEFQNSNRMRLLRATSEKEKKATKFACMAQQELKRRSDLEKQAEEEKVQLQREVEKQRAHCQSLEARYKFLNIYAFEVTLLTLRYIISLSLDSGIGGDSSVSFFDAVTSTPVQGVSPLNRFTSTGHRDRDHIGAMFQTVNGSAPSPIVNADAMMTTPAMLGLKKKSHRQAFLYNYS